MDDNAEISFEAAKRLFGNYVVGLSQISWSSVPLIVVNYLRANPTLTAFQCTCLLAGTVPGLVATPALVGLGFGSNGPIAGMCPTVFPDGILADIAGWLASTFKSMYGTPVLFSTLQGAAMGGWGSCIVNSIIQGFSVVVAGVTVLVKGQSKH